MLESFTRAFAEHTEGTSPEAGYAVRLGYLQEVRVGGRACRLVYKTECTVWKACCCACSLMAGVLHLKQAIKQSWSCLLMAGPLPRECSILEQLVR